MAEQILHCCAQRLTLVKDSVDLIDNRRLNSKPARALKCAARRRHSLRNHLHVRLDAGERLGLAETLAHSAITTVLAKTGRNQIACTAQTIEGARVSAHSGTKTQQFTEIACHQSRFVIIAEIYPVARSSCDRKNVL